MPPGAASHRGGAVKGERWALSAGEYLVARACRRLPAEIREERYREWVAELPVILHDRDAGPAPRRVVRMLTFAADTLRGTTLAAGAYQYQGAHRRDDFENNHALALGLLVVFWPLAPLAFEGWIIYQLIFGANLVFSANLTVWGLFFLIRRRIRRSDSAGESWFFAGFLAQGTGLLVRAVASQCGWGHPLLFAIVSYCGYAISAACFGVAVALLVRSQVANTPQNHMEVD
jgi:hypothetical protein